MAVAATSSSSPDPTRTSHGAGGETALGSSAAMPSVAGDLGYPSRYETAGPSYALTGRLSRSARMLLALVAALVIMLLLTKRYYFADGAAYFFRILERGDFLAFDWQRQFAQYATQFPVVAALKLGVTWRAMLSALFGAGLYAPYFVSLLLCHRILRDSEPQLMAFPLLAYATASFDSSFSVVSEAHVPAAIFWPMFFYIYVREQFKLLDSATLLSLALLSVLTYASTAFLAPLLLVGVARRLVARPRNLRRSLYWGAVASALIAAFLCGLEALIFPRDPANRQSAVTALSYLKDYLPVIYTGVTFLGVVTMVAIAGPAPAARRRVVAVLSAVALAFVAAALIEPELIRPVDDFHARVLLVLMPAALGAIALVYVLRGVRLGDGRWAGVFQVIWIAVVFQLLWQANATYQWYGFCQTFQDEISSHHGLLPFEDSLLARDRVGLQTLRQMIWGWTNPFMSVVIARNGQVNALLLPPADESFRPIDPVHPPDLSRYGIHYDYLHGSEPRGCGALSVGLRRGRPRIGQPAIVSGKRLAPACITEARDRLTFQVVKAGILSYTDRAPMRAQTATQVDVFEIADDERPRQAALVEILGAPHEEAGRRRRRRIPCPGGKQPLRKPFPRVGADLQSAPWLVGLIDHPRMLYAAVLIQKPGPDRADLRCQHRSQPPEPPVRKRKHVGIQEQQQIPARLLRTKVTGAREPKIASAIQDAEWQPEQGVQRLGTLNGLCHEARVVDRE